MSESADEAAIDAQFDELLDASTLNSPAAKYISSLAPDPWNPCANTAPFPPPTAHCQGTCWLPGAIASICEHHGLCEPCHYVPATQGGGKG